MSRPWETLVSRLKQDNAIYSIVAGRIYPEIIPQTAALPAIAYEVSSCLPMTNASGTDSTSQTNISLVIVAATYAAARDLANAVFSVLTRSVDGFGNVWHLTSQSDVPGNIAPGQDIYESYMVAQDYTVWHTTG